MKYVIMISLALLTACAQKTNDEEFFKAGKKTTTPYGCQEGKARGVEC